MTRVGLVLAGGGITGMAFHTGALAAVEEVTGWDPRDAELIIGTSAGSLAGAILRLGVPTSDQIARITGGTPSAATQALFAKVGATGPPQFPRFEPPKSLTPVDPDAVRRALRKRGAARRLGLLAAAIPEGVVDNTAMRDNFGPLFDGYPDGLWVCAIHVSDGKLVVFGRDITDVSVADAVAASSAIPGFFKPVEVHGEKYVDGGLRSMANADLAEGHGFDVVIVSSPMTFSTIAPGVAGGALAGPLRNRLRREIRHIRGSGTPVLVLEPDLELRRTMGANPMDPSRRPATTLAALASVRTMLGKLDLAKFSLG